MFYGKDEFNQIMSAERYLFEASMDLSRMLPITDLDETIDDLESVEYQALNAVLKVKEIKAKLGVEKDEN